MYSMQANVAEVLGDFHIEGVAMRYSQFVPRLYNLSLSLGFKPGKIDKSCNRADGGFGGAIVIHESNVSAGPVRTFYIPCIDGFASQHHQSQRFQRFC